MNAVTLQRHRTLTRVIVWLVIISFSVATLAGIAVLLGAEMNETSAKVLLTTVIVGGYGLAALSGLGLLGHRLAWFGLVTIAVAVIGLLYTLIFVWGDGFDNGAKTWEWLGTLITLAVFFSAAARLLLLVDREHNIVRVGMSIALVFLTLSAAIVINLIWEFVESTDQSFRLYGVIWILTALAVVVTPILGVVLKPKEPQTDASPAAPVVLSASAISQLVAEAARRGVTPDELVGQLLEQDALE